MCTGAALSVAAIAGCGGVASDPPPGVPTGVSRPEEVPAREPVPSPSDEFGGRLFRCTEPRIYARAGDGLVIPLTLAPGVTPGDGVQVRRGNPAGSGSPARAETLGLVRVGPARDAAGQQVVGPRDRVRGWMPARDGGGPWAALTAQDAQRRMPFGAWVVWVPPGDAGERDAGVTIEGEAAPVVVVREAAALESEGEAVLKAAALARWAGCEAAWAERVLGPAVEAPLSRWRARLALDAAGGGRDVGPEAGRVRREAVGTDDRPRVLDALAEQAAWRWRAGLGRLAAADRALAFSVAERLLLAVEVGPGRRVPAWPSESAETDRLLDALLDPDREGSDVVAHARTWLESQPPIVAWVSDDAGQAGAVPAESLATISVANITSGALVASARARGVESGRGIEAGAAAGGIAGPMGEPVKIGPGRIEPVLVLCPTGGGGNEDGGNPAAAPVTVVSVSAGSLRRTLGVFAPPARMGAPGLTIGPLAADMTLAAWTRGGLASGPAAEPPARATAALLHAPATAQPGARLVLYLEGERTPARPDGGDTPAGDWVRVWVGPTGRPLRVLAVSSEGRVVDQTASARGSSLGADQPEFTRAEPTLRAGGDAERWSVWVPIPDTAHAETGVLRLGLERFDGDGERSAWPRPMLPWQAEPGRAAIMVGRSAR